MAEVEFATENEDFHHSGGICKGYSLAWLERCNALGRTPNSRSEMPTRRSAGFRMLQYDALFSGRFEADDADGAVLDTARHHSLGHGIKTKSLFGSKKGRFVDAARFVTEHAGGYLVETASHSMAAWNDGAAITFFDANDGQYRTMTARAWVEFYPGYVLRWYSTHVSEWTRLY